MGTEIEIISPGMLTTVQDEGRFGYRRLGIPSSGAMDQYSYMLANRLVNNTKGEAALEMTMWGGSCRFTDAALCAITGADMQAELDGAPIKRNRSFCVSAGSVLTFKPAVNGCRTYLAVAGGIDTPPVLGSRSTYIKGSLGGHCGRALKRGDKLPVGVPAEAQEKALVAEEADAEHYLKKIYVSVIPGPQDDYFSAEENAAFYSAVYTVSDKSDRMGIRLEGLRLKGINGTDIVSDGTVIGSIQITGEGLPIVLMSDCQTTGGYAKIATVCSEGLHLLSQAVPGTKVVFVNSDAEGGNINV